MDSKLTRVHIMKEHVTQCNVVSQWLDLNILFNSGLYGKETFAISGYIGNTYCNTYYTYLVRIFNLLLVLFFSLDLVMIQNMVNITSLVLYTIQIVFAFSVQYEWDVSWWIEWWNGKQYCSELDSEELQTNGFTPSISFLTLLQKMWHFQCMKQFNLPPFLWKRL